MSCSNINTLEYYIKKNLKEANILEQVSNYDNINVKTREHLSNIDTNNCLYNIRNERLNELNGNSYIYTDALKMTYLLKHM